MSEGRPRRMFCFGLGYSAQVLARGLAAEGWRIEVRHDLLHRVPVRGPRGGGGGLVCAGYKGSGAELSSRWNLRAWSQCVGYGAARPGAAYC